MKRLRLAAGGIGERYKPSNKLLAVTELDSDTWVAEAKRIRGKKQPLTAAGLHALRDEYTRTIEPARALAAETLTLEGTLSDLVNQAYGLTPAEIDLMWQTAPPRMPIPPNQGASVLVANYLRIEGLALFAGQPETSFLPFRACKKAKFVFVGPPPTNKPSCWA